MKSYPLKHLLATNISKSTVQILDPLHNVRNLAGVLALDFTGRANGDVQGQLHSRGTGQPASGLRVWREADPVLTSFGGGESEATGMLSSLRDDSVVIVKCLLDGDEHVQGGILNPGVGVLIESLRFVVSCGVRDNTCQNRNYSINETTV
jgi:hypothetical protein